MNTNSSSLGLLTVPNPGSSFHTGQKPPKDLDQMIQLFRQRGLSIRDEENFRRKLFDCNYYRLSGYFRVFQKDPINGDNMFREGTEAEDFLRPYLMDVKLREMILHGTALVELTLRSRFAYLVASNGGAYSYRDTSSYVDRRGRDALLKNIDKWIKASSEVCIRRYLRLKADIPLWAAIETLPFDTISRMLSLYADTEVLKCLYKTFGLNMNLRSASELVHSMVYLRNLCSHHSRLWHRETVITPPRVKRIRARYSKLDGDVGSVANALAVLVYFADAINGDSSYSTEIIDFLSKDAAYRNGIMHPLRWK